MDVFEGRYFNINRKLLTSVSLWPYATKWKIPYRITIMVVHVSLMAPQVISAFINYEDVDRLMLNIVCFLCAIVMFLKLVSFWTSESELENLYESIADNFLTIRDEKEREILIEYSERGRFLTILYTFAILSSGALISVIPMIPHILDEFDPLDEPRAVIYFMEGEYFVARDEHFLSLFFCDSALVMLSILITVGVDSMYFVACQHACALYAIVSYRLRNLRRTMGEDESYGKVVSAMELHQTALSFTSKISDTYSICFLFIMTVNLPLIPLEACMIISHMHSLIGLVPYVILFSMITGHLFFLFGSGQFVLDHGANLYVDACNNEWYDCPQPTKKLLMVFMSRCTQPASVSAGGLFVMNMELFSAIMRTAVSYITVLASFRNN